MQVFRDYRSLDTATLEGVLRQHPDSSMLTAWQLATLSERPAYERTLVVVPDFLNYARLLNTGQAKSMLALSGSLLNGFRAGLSAAPALLKAPLRTVRMDFWLIAECLLRYDLALLPAGYGGAILLHSYLSDFGFVFDRRDFVERFFTLAGNRCKAGVHTQQLPMALSCFSRWGIHPGLCAYLPSLDDRDGHASLEAARCHEQFRCCSFVADLSSYPGDLQADNNPALGRVESLPSIIINGRK
jgi:hypothetical protein